MRVRNHVRWEHRTDPAAVAVPPVLPRHAGRARRPRAALRQHRGHGRAVGEMLAALERDGLAEEHGRDLHRRDHGDGLPRAKRWLYDSGIRVPPDRALAGPASSRAASRRAGELRRPRADPPRAAGARRSEQHRRPRPPGPTREPAPEYVFAARDRMDESTDRVRAVRDAASSTSEPPPRAPYQLPNPVPRPSCRPWQELTRLHDAGELIGRASALVPRAAAARGALRHRGRPPRGPRPRRRSDASQPSSRGCAPRSTRWLAAPHPTSALLPEDELRRALLARRRAAGDRSARVRDRRRTGNAAQRDGGRLARLPRRRRSVAPLHRAVRRCSRARASRRRRCATAGRRAKRSCRARPGLSSRRTSRPRRVRCGAGCSGTR